MRFASAFLLVAALADGGVYLEPNRGQARAAARFLARTPSTTISLGASSMAFVRTNGWSSALVFEGASSHARPAPERPIAGVTHYLPDGDPAHWTWDLPRYSSVRYRGVYPGIDLLYRISGNAIEFDFLLAPGADPSRIRMRMPSGARVDAAGTLAFAGMSLHPPVAWQTVDGRRAPVAARFVLDGRERASFELGRYDRKRALTIDPVVQFATFLGGSSNDNSQRVLSGADGSIYVAGNTVSADFPAAVTPENPFNRPGLFLRSMIYVARLKPDGSAFDWSIFLGGSGRQVVLGLKQDSLGNVYVLGATTSANFPTTPGTWHTSIDPVGCDLFVVKLDARTGHLKASTFLGTTRETGRMEYTAMLAVDPAGGVYVGGVLRYTNTFPPTPGAFSSLKPVSQFVLRLNSALSAPVYASSWPVGSIVGMDVDSGGNLWIAGREEDPSQSGLTPLPSVNPLPGFAQTPGQAYVARLNPAGNSLSLLSRGGGGVTDLKIAPDGSIYISGTTAGASFPRVNPLAMDSFPPDRSPDSDYASYPFLLRISADTRSLLQATPFNRTPYVEEAGQILNTNLRLAFQANGLPCLAGLNTPIAYQTPGAFGSELFYNYWSLSCVDAAGAKIDLRTILPPSGGTGYADIASTPDGAFLFAGNATAGFVATNGAVQPGFGGTGPFGYYGYPDLTEGDGFLLRVSLDNPAPAIQSISPDAVVVSTANTANCSLTMTGSAFAYGGVVALNGQALKSTFADARRVTASYDCATLQAGDNRVTITLPAPGGGTSEIVMAAINAPPLNTSVSPSSVTQGAGEIKVVIRATNLTVGSTLFWNGSARAAVYVLDGAGTRTGHFELILPPSELAQPGSITVTVSNPGPGGGVSQPVLFVVQPAAGAAVPLLATPQLFVYGDATEPGARVTLTGTGFTATTRVFWDGVELPVSSFTPTTLVVQPPFNDLTHFGAHSIYVRNGAFQSQTVRFLAGRSVFAAGSAYDPAQKRLYLLSRSFSLPNDGGGDLLILNGVTGEVLRSAPSIAPSARSLALSANGQYVYLGGGNGSIASIVRFNTTTAAVDLEWKIPPSPGLTSSEINSMVTPPDSPETVIVSLVSGRVVIYDRDRARPYDSVSAGLSNGYYGGYPLLFALGARVFAGDSQSTSCVTWMDFDAFGFLETSPSCAPQPPDTRHDHGVAYLSDGSRSYALAFPTSGGFAGQLGSTAVDPAGRRAWQYGLNGNNQLVEYQMDAQQLQLKSQINLFSPQLGKVYPAGDGAVVLVLAGYVLGIP